jgi:tyrosinase
VHTEQIALEPSDLPAALSRADLVMLDTEHGGHSFEARVFFNNTGANADTPTDDANGYAGTFHIFGHGGCFGDAGHCVVNDRGQAAHDLRGQHPLSPIRTELTVTDALQRTLQSGGLKTVTLVPLALGRPTTGDPANEDVLHYSSLKLLTYG